jgi:hypothetical protein
MGPNHFTPGKATNIQRREVWMDLRASLDDLEKRNITYLSRELNPVHLAITTELFRIINKLHVHIIIFVLNEPVSITRYVASHCRVVSEK